MPDRPDRFGPSRVELAAGWSYEYLIPPSRLYGANGLRTGKDGLIYVAQLTGHRISTIDPDSGEIAHLESTGTDILGPDDLAFDDAGTMFVTEYTENRIAMRAPGGASRTLVGDIFGANPITFHQGRLIAGECRMGARIMELDRNGGAPRVIAEGIPMANAFEVGPDGKLYFPVMGANEIWRVNLDGTGCEVVVGDLGVPDSVKFDAKGRIVSTQVGSGQVLRIDVQTGERTVLAEIGPGLDNCTFVGERLFVSHMAGAVHEVLAPGELRELNAKGLMFPMGLATSADGSIYVADGSHAYLQPPGGPVGLIGMIFTPGFPTFHRGVAAAGPGEWFVTTSMGEIRRWNPATQENSLVADGFERLMGIAALASGGLVTADAVQGKVWLIEGKEHTALASGLDAPSGVAVGDDGTIYVTETGAGRIVRLTSGKAETVADGFLLPEGLAFHDGSLFVVDVTARAALCSIDPATGRRSTIATGLQVGAPHGPRKYLGPAGEFSGPMVSFAGLAAASDGTLYLGADGNGSVMAFRNRA